MRTLPHLVLGLGFAVVLSACDKRAEGAAGAMPALPVAAIAAEAPVVAAAADAAVFAFDQSSSTIGFTGKKVTGAHTGGFGAFSGEVWLGKDAASSSVTLSIDMASVTSDSEKLTGHLKSADFFDVATFPQATFSSTSVTPGGEGGATHTVKGNLALHGVTKSVAFPATLQTSPDRVSLKSSFALDRKAFQINYPGRANDLISDHVELSLDVTATPKPVAPPPAADALPPPAPTDGERPAAPQPPAGGTVQCIRAPCP